MDCTSSIDCMDCFLFLGKLFFPRNVKESDEIWSFLLTGFFILPKAICFASPKNRVIFLLNLKFNGFFLFFCPLSFCLFFVCSLFFCFVFGLLLVCFFFFKSNFLFFFLFCFSLISFFGSFGKIKEANAGSIVTCPVGKNDGMGKKDKGKSKSLGERVI